MNGKKESCHFSAIKNKVECFEKNSDEKIGTRKILQVSYRAHKTNVENIIKTWGILGFVCFKNEFNFWLFF